MGPKDRTQTIRFGSSHLYPLSHLTGPNFDYVDSWIPSVKEKLRSSMHSSRNRVNRWETFQIYKTASEGFCHYKFMDYLCNQISAILSGCYFLKVFTVRAEHFAQARNSGKKEDEKKRDSSEGALACAFSPAPLFCA